VNPKSAPAALEIMHGGSSALPGEPQRIERGHGSGNALSGIGRGAESIMRVQAVAATTIAPINAIARLQPSAGLHCEEERVPRTKKGRAQCQEGDLSNKEGDGAGN